MKKLITILFFVFLGGVVFSQEADSVLVSKEQLIKAATTIKNQRDTIRIGVQIINELEKQVGIQSIMLENKDNEITLCGEQLSIAHGTMERYGINLDKQKIGFFKKPWVNFVLGATLTTVLYISISN